MKRIILSCMLPLALSACGMSPKHLTSRGQVASSVKVINIPAGMQISVNGNILNDLTKGIVMTSLPDGWHRLDMKLGDRLVSTQKVFLQDGIQKVIDASAQ